MVKASICVKMLNWVIKSKRNLIGAVRIDDLEIIVGLGVIRVEEFPDERSCAVTGAGRESAMRGFGPSTLPFRAREARWTRPH